MLTEIRIIKDEGNHRKMNGLPFLTDEELGSPQVLDSVTITHVLPKVYPTGTLTFEHTFPESGKFIGIVTVRNENGQTYVSQFPFSVGPDPKFWVQTGLQYVPQAGYTKSIDPVPEQQKQVHEETVDSNELVCNNSVAIKILHQF